MEILTYETSPVEELLNDEIIRSNMVEADKICDSRYIMSAGTAWLRKNKGKSLYDLQQAFREHGLNTVIYPQEHESSDYGLCVPGSGLGRRLKYVADFISNPALISGLPEVDMEILRDSGYSCSLNYVENEPPSLARLQRKGIHERLQWAGVQFTIKTIIVNPDEELEKDLARARQRGEVELKQISFLSYTKEKIYAYVNSRNEYVSAFGILEKCKDRSKSRIVIHLPTYLHESDLG